MTPPPIPANEEGRLAALRALLVLDTDPEERFDRIVAFAAEEFGVPIALVSLIDRTRQWFKARVGMDVCETGRDISFCAHAILGADVFVIPDALQDARFRDNPLVTGGTHIRFYAGAPLMLVSGEIVGTLCVIDTVPRDFDAMDKAILATLGKIVSQELQGAMAEP
jgi:GAF domain-containing protein